MKQFITQEIRTKSRHFSYERMKTIIYFRKNMVAQPSFYIKMNKRLATRLRKPSYESTLVAHIKLRVTILKAKYEFFTN